MQTQATGISEATVPKLALRWQVQLPQGSSSYAREIYASPVVYAGNVIVVARYPATVYDYSAIDGSLLWSRQIGGESLKTPTIDPVSGLVFVGNRIATSQGHAGPSSLYALHFTDGSVAWSVTVPGTRAAPKWSRTEWCTSRPRAAIRRRCLNEGIEALDESTGNVKWQWLENPGTNPGGGGAVWGAIAYDGSRLIFGTANACQVITTANGAAALDLNGKLLWADVAVKDSTIDQDTGGGVMIRNNAATFLNKNGIDVHGRRRDRDRFCAPRRRIRTGATASSRARPATAT